MSTGPDPRTMALRRRLPRALVAACAISALAITASPAGANTGPVTVSIASVGGYQMCLNNILYGDTIHRFQAVAGTRHPYRAALYRNDDSVLGLSNPTSDNLVWYWDETVHFPGQDGRRIRIDNQATASGNGSYKCESLAV